MGRTETSLSVSTLIIWPQKVLTSQAKWSEAQDVTHFNVNEIPGALFGVFYRLGSSEPQFPALCLAMHRCFHCHPHPHLARDDRTRRRYKNISAKEVQTHQEEWGESAKTHRHMPNSAPIHPNRVTIVFFYLYQSTMWLSVTKLLSTLPEYSGNWLSTVKKLSSVLN